MDISLINKWLIDFILWVVRSATTFTSNSSVCVFVCVRHCRLSGFSTQLGRQNHYEPMK